jgi:hypothetical protein
VDTGKPQLQVPTQRAGHSSTSPHTSRRMPPRRTTPMDSRTASLSQRATQARPSRMPIRTSTLRKTTLHYYNAFGDFESRAEGLHILGLSFISKTTSCPDMCYTGLYSSIYRLMFGDIHTLHDRIENCRLQQLGDRLTRKLVWSK